MEILFDKNDGIHSGYLEGDKQIKAAAFLLAFFKPSRGAEVVSTFALTKDTETKTRQFPERIILTSETVKLLLEICAENGHDTIETDFIESNIPDLFGITIDDEPKIAESAQ